MSAELAFSSNSCAVRQVRASMSSSFHNFQARTKASFLSADSLAITLAKSSSQEMTLNAIMFDSSSQFFTAISLKLTS